MKNIVLERDFSLKIVENRKVSIELIRDTIGTAVIGCMNAVQLVVKYTYDKEISNRTIFSIFL